MDERSAPPYFQREHERLEEQLHAHLLDVIGGDFVQALAQLQAWRQALAQHIAVEEQQLLPHLPEGARWAARVYLLEHERIDLLAEEHTARLQAVAASPPTDALQQRRTALALIDGAHALRHVIEHHHEREHNALAMELPEALQAQVWARVGTQK